MRDRSVALTGSSPFETWLREAARDASGPVAAPRAPLRAGAALGHGRFIVGGVLGRGGMGTVYAVRDTERGVSLALKTMLDTEPARLLAFKNEFRSLQGLHHPNLVYLDELFEDDGQWFFTMERVHGVSFTRFVRPRRLDPERLRASLTQLAEGLMALHGAGKVHRDVKPSNTLVEASGRLVLLDFGMVADAGGAQRGRPGFGTIAYMAPEQASGHCEPAADWYAAGVMLYEALTGTLPFSGPPARILAQKQRQTAPPPVRRADDVPPDLAQLCVELLDHCPGARPDGAEVMRRLRGTTPSSPRGPAPTTDGTSPPAEPGARPGPSSFVGSFVGSLAGSLVDSFVGRARELRELHELFGRARARGPLTVMIRGESGVGKTSLLERFAFDLGAGARVLVGRCHEREFVPFKALDGVVDALADLLDQLGDDALPGLLPPRFAALARVFPVLERARRRGARSAPATPPLSAPGEARREAFAAFRELLWRLAARAPLVLIIDDLQWADADSLAAFDELLRDETPAPILLVALARSGTDLPRVPGDLVAMQLEALASDDATELARRLLGETPGASPPPDPRRIAEEAGCHPLFIEALLRHARATDGRHDVRLDEALAYGVRALDARARDLVEVVSLAAQPLPPSAVARAAGLAPEPMARAVHGLQTDHLVLTRRVGAELSTVEPYHDRVRHAVVTCMAAERQAACHRRIAEALEAVAPERSEALAVHWQACGDAARARAHAITAGQRARQALAFDRAASFFQLAADLAPPAEEPGVDRPVAGAALAPPPALLRRWHAEALASAGRGAQAAASYHAAAQLAPAAERWELELSAAEQLLRAGHVDEGLAEMERLLAPLGLARPRDAAAALRMLLGEHLRAAVESARLRFLSRRAAPARALERHVDACWAMAVGLSQFDPAAAAIFQLRHLRLARRLGDPRRIALGLCMCAPPQGAAGPPATRARRMLAEARALLGGRGDARAEGYHSMAAGMIAFMCGEWSEALARGELAVALFRESDAGVGWETASAQRFVLDCLWHTGQLRELATRARAAWLEAGARADRYATIQIETTVLPVVHLKDDDPRAARALLEASLSAWPRTVLSIQRWQHAQARLLVELYCGRTQEALALIADHVDPITRAVLSRMKAVRVFTGILRSTAVIAAAARAAGGERRALMRRARRELRRIEREGVPECTVLVRGQIAFLAGDRSAALDDLTTAARLFTERRMGLLGAVVGWGWGVVAGGRAGEQRRREAEGWMAAQEIRRPEGFVQLFGPAFVRG